MKTIEEIKNEVAVKHGYVEWNDIPFVDRCEFTDEVAEEYARQCCEEQIKACAENEPKENIQRFIYEQSKEFTTNGLTFGQVIKSSYHGNCSVDFIESIVAIAANKYAKDKILNTPNVVTTKP